MFVSLDTVGRIFSPPTPPNEIAAGAAALRIFAGTSGWAYPTWKPGFYPASLAPKRFLEFYGSRFPSVEVNYTFRALPTVKLLAEWSAAVPEYFRFSFKAPQQITHTKRLKGVDGDVEHFFSLLAPVREARKMGLVLFQLPPNMKADAGLLRAFLDARTFASSPAIAFEFRNDTWFSDEMYEVLSSHNAALCIAENDDAVCPEVHTAATHTSFRLRRTGAYSRRMIAGLAEQFLVLAQSRDVYVYFKHEDEPTGALNTTALLEAIAKNSKGARA